MAIAGAKKTINWRKIREEFLTTTLSLREIADAFRVSYDVVRRRSAREKWVSLREERQKKETDAVISASAEAAAANRVMMYEIGREALMMVGELLKSGDFDIKKITGALRDLKEVLDLKSEEDILEQKERIAKLKHDYEAMKEQAREITVTIQGAGDGWAE